jgi:hypothetical protein
MATSILWRKDIEALSVRLLSRSRSILLDDQPDLQADLLITGKVLQILLRSPDHMSDPIEIDGC